MDLHTLPIITLLFCMAMVGSYAATAPEEYWKAVLPNTPMPGAVWNSLPHPEWMENKGTAVSVGKGGVHVDTGKPSGGHTHVDVGPKGGVGVSTGKPGGGHTDVTVGPKHGVGVITGKPGKGGADVGVGKGGVIVHAGPKKKPVFVGVTPGPDPFVYLYAASEAQLLDDPTRALFFLENNMKPGSKMTLHFSTPTNTATFLPREDATATSLSSARVPETLREYSVEPGSQEALVIENTVKECESKGIQGEKKYCATSLESMIDYATSTLGSNNVKAISTTSTVSSAQKYTVTGVSKAARDDEAVACHKQKYVYAVFYCHKTKTTSAYTVSLVGEDGSVAKAVAVCHKDTSGWNPKHLAFQVLKVKPGSVPICHFLPQDHIVWVPNN